MLNLKNLGTFVAITRRDYREFNIARSSRQQAFAQARLILEDTIGLITSSLDDPKIDALVKTLTSNKTVLALRKNFICMELGLKLKDDKDDIEFLLELSDVCLDFHNMQDEEWKQFIREYITPLDTSDILAQSNTQSSSTSSTSSTVTEATPSDVTSAKIQAELLSETIKFQEETLSSVSDERQRARLENVIKLNKDLLRRTLTQSAPSKRNTISFGDDVEDYTQFNRSKSFGLTKPTSQRADLSLWRKLHSLYESIVAQDYATDTQQLTEILNSDLLERSRWKAEDAIQKVDDQGISVIHLAAPYPNDLKFLLDILTDTQKKAMVGKQDNTSKSPWHYAALNERSLKVLAEVSQDTAFTYIRQLDENLMSVLHHAASNPLAAQFLLSYYPDDHKETAILQKDMHGMSALHHAAINHFPRRGVGSNVLAINYLLTMLPETIRLAELIRDDADGMSVFHHVAKESGPNLSPGIFYKLLKSLSVDDQQTAIRYLIKNELTTQEALTAERNNHAPKPMPELTSTDKKAVQIGDEGKSTEKPLAGVEAVPVKSATESHDDDGDEPTISPRK